MPCVSRHHLVAYCSVVWRCGRDTFGSGHKIMALTLEADQRLDSVGLTTFFDEGEDSWLSTARDTKKFVTEHFPAGAKIRRDDVAKALVPILEGSRRIQGLSG
jgi:hypothetical protein